MHDCPISPIKTRVGEELYLLQSYLELLVRYIKLVHRWWGRWWWKTPMWTEIETLKTNFSAVRMVNKGLKCIHHQGKQVFVNLAIKWFPNIFYSNIFGYIHLYRFRNQLKESGTTCIVTLPTTALLASSDRYIRPQGHLHW